MCLFLRLSTNSCFFLKLFKACFKQVKIFSDSVMRKAYLVQQFFELNPPNVDTLIMSMLARLLNRHNVTKNNQIVQDIITTTISNPYKVELRLKEICFACFGQKPKYGTNLNVDLTIVATKHEVRGSLQILQVMLDGVFIKFNGKPSNSCGDISFETTKWFWYWRKNQSLGFIIWKPQKTLCPSIDRISH